MIIKDSNKIEMRYYITALFLINMHNLNFSFKSLTMPKQNLTLQKQFGENLKKIRMAKGLSLRALASNCDLDDSNISKIEQGKFNIQLSTLFELAKGLGIEVKELVEFEM